MLTLVVLGGVMEHFIEVGNVVVLGGLVVIGAGLILGFNRQLSKADTRWRRPNSK